MWFLLVCGSGGVGIVATVGRSCSLPAAGTRVLPLARKRLSKERKEQQTQLKHKQQEQQQHQQQHQQQQQQEQQRRTTAQLAVLRALVRHSLGASPRRLVSRGSWQLPSRQLS